MPQKKPKAPNVQEIMEQIRAIGPAGLDFESKLNLLVNARKTDGNTSLALDQQLVHQVESDMLAMRQAKSAMADMEALVEKMGQPPWYTATFLHPLTDNNGRPRAMIWYGRARMVVEPGEGINMDEIRRGQEVFLNPSGNVLMSVSPDWVPPHGEIAMFDRRMPDGRIVLKADGDKETIVEDATSRPDNPNPAQLNAGDRIRWSRDAYVAYEKVESSDGDDLFLADTPDVTFDMIGGLDTQIIMLRKIIERQLAHPELVSKYGLKRKGSALLLGPPGTGKTMIAKALANFMASISKTGKSRFMSFKPGELHTMWYAQSEANYREAFRVAKKLGEQDPEVPVVMFWDEVDSVGMTRGQCSTQHVSDRVLTSFMAELDGLTDRGNILVVAASNRRDSIDPALMRPGRLGDLPIEIPRPNKAGAKDIFGKYLVDELPYTTANGKKKAKATIRREMIGLAVDKIYANDDANVLGQVTFRNGQQKPIRFCDLVNGAVIASICQNAIERACDREADGGTEGLIDEDVMYSIGEAFVSQAKSLTPQNAIHHLTDVPAEMGVAHVNLRT